ncbi:putative esterase [Alteromonadaceae bacterium 2753L.S.0a.02]|nr:putative esterase [Alteromonadaceae bacterium 2753L.S.0a.02]
MTSFFFPALLAPFSSRAIALLTLIALLPWPTMAESQSAWRVETFSLTSKQLQQNKLALNVQREIWVWLPPGYDQSTRRYPVIHYIHNYGWSAQQMHEVERIGETFSRALARGQTDEFIFVVGDYRATHTPGVFCGNNTVVGRWWDYTSKELVAAVDKRYRTIAKPEARGLAGDFIGGYCAIRVAMERPGVFSSVYALHPVGTASDRILRSEPEWQLLNTARSYQDLKGMNPFTQAYLLMAQSHVPNPNKPPFYANFLKTLDHGELSVAPKTLTELRNNFALKNRVGRFVEPLKSLRGFMFDWGRQDPNQAHVTGNRQFAWELEQYGIPHFAEEYRGNEWSEKWIPYGRVEDRMLPFFKRYLELE